MIMENFLLYSYKIVRKNIFISALKKGKKDKKYDFFIIGTYHLHLFSFIKNS